MSKSNLAALPADDNTQAPAAAEPPAQHSISPAAVGALPIVIGRYQGTAANTVSSVDPVVDGPDEVSADASKTTGEPTPKSLFGLLSITTAQRWAVRLFAVALGVVAWHFASTYDLNFYINFENVPEPLVVWNAFTSQLAGSEFYIHVAVSLQRILLGYSIAVVLGVGLGMIMGRSRLAQDVFMPYVEILRPIPAVAWIPLAILMWPTEEASIIYITFLGALFPIILNTMHGVEQTPEVLVRAARSLGAKHSQIFRHVVLPAALPSIATGLAVAMGVSWFSLLAGEIISGQYGIGYFTWNAYSLINYPDIIVGMLCIGFLGTLSTYAVRLATKPFLSWQERTR
jgi:NitT/TauT family transport system permease protein